MQLSFWPSPFIAIYFSQVLVLSWSYSFDSSGWQLARKAKYFEARPTWRDQFVRRDKVTRRAFCTGVAFLTLFQHILLCDVIWIMFGQALCNMKLWPAILSWWHVVTNPAILIFMKYSILSILIYIHIHPLAMLSAFVGFRIIVVFPHGCKELLVLSTFYHGASSLGCNQPVQRNQPATRLCEKAKSAAKDFPCTRGCK